MFFGITQKDGAGPREGSHYAFCAESTKEVDAWYEAAIKAGAKDNGKAGPRPAYGPHFYGAFVHDPVDGNHLECCFKKYNADHGDTKKETAKAPSVYYYYGTRAMRVIWMAQECGVKLDMHNVELPKGEQRKEEYLKINPYGTVPSLVDGDTILTNSVSCTLYIANKFGGDKFRTTDPTASEFITSIDRFDDVIIKAFLNKVVYPEDKLDADVVKKNHETFTNSVLPHWNRLATKLNPYAMGEKFTVTDVVWGYLLNLTLGLGWITEKDHPKLHEYALKLKAREGFKSAYDRENPMYPKKV